MNYRQFFKNKKVTAEDIQKLLPEGVDQKQFNMGIKTEKEHTDDEFTAAKIAGDHLKEDPKYYSKLDQAGLEEEGQEQDECGMQDEHCGACEDDMGDEYDDNGGLPKIGGVLNVPHLGDPIRMAKIISVGPIGKGPANGELSGYSNIGGGSGKGVTKDQGGVAANQEGDKEPITAGGKKADGSIATKSVGGSVVPGEGQKQGGPNSKGTIADTAKMDEGKQKVRKIVKEVLKEITFDKKTGKWVRLTEGGHKAGCKCGFCKNKGTFGKKKKEDKEDKSEEMDETVDVKMGPSYKTVQPRMYKVQDDDFARTNQYDPEITEMYDEEEECMAEQRYTELVNAPRNLNESEIAEMKELNEKIEKMQTAKRNYGLSQGGVEPNIYENQFGEHPDDERERAEWQRGISKYNRRNPHRFPCPTCGTENALSAHEKKMGYQCQSCADAEDGPMGGGGLGGEYQNENDEKLSQPKMGWGSNMSGECGICGRDHPTDQCSQPGAKEFYKKDSLSKPPKGIHPKFRSGGDSMEENTVNMRMGPAHKVVAPTQARVQADDQARTIQYDPEMTEGGEPSGDMKLSEEEIQSLMKAEVHDAGKESVVQQGHKGQDGFRLWICPKCGHELSVPATEHRPDPIRWDDGHICYFQQAKEEGEGIGAEPVGIGEAGGGAVQHSSMRTVGNGGNLPQDPETRWANDLDEVTKKVSKAVKAIQKGQKAKKTKKNPKLKFQPTKHTTSGVHKRKT